MKWSNLQEGKDICSKKDWILTKKWSPEKNTLAYLPRTPMDEDFIILIPVANFIKLFWCNLYCYQCITLSFDQGYTARGINYAKKVL
jgi:hypothetical protein